MKTKRLLAVVLVLLIAFAGLAAQAGESTPLLWEVTDENGHTLYLFGTIHMAEETLYPLPGAVMEAFEASDALALELDITTAALEMMLLPEYAQTMYLPQGDSIANHLSADVLERAAAFLEEAGYPTSMLQGYTPMGWYSLIEAELSADCALSPDYGVDMHLATMAKEREMPLLEVESAQLQLQLLGGFSDELYDLMIDSMLMATDLYAEQLEMMYEFWRRGNETMLTYMTVGSTAGLSEEEEALMEGYNDELITKRNASMTDFAQASLESGDTVFMAVGAGHMVGQDGIVSQLRQRGYTVKKIKY